MAHCLGIDLVVGNSAMFQSISEISYKPRNISDRSHLVIGLIVGSLSNLSRAPWKFNAFRLKLFLSHVDLEGSMQRFFTDQIPTNSILTQWEAFKAYLRGLLITEMTKVKRH